MAIIATLREFRILGYAVFDFVVSFLGIYLLAPRLSRLFRRINLDISTKSWMFFTLPIGIMAHLLTRTMTPLTVSFLNLSGHYFVKILIIGSFILGAVNVKVIKKHKK